MTKYVMIMVGSLVGAVKSLERWLFYSFGASAFGSDAAGRQILDGRMPALVVCVSRLCRRFRCRSIHGDSLFTISQEGRYRMMLAPFHSVQRTRAIARVADFYRTAKRVLSLITRSPQSSLVSDDDEAFGLVVVGGAGKVTVGLHFFEAAILEQAGQFGG